MFNGLGDLRRRVNEARDLISRWGGYSVTEVGYMSLGAKDTFRVTLSPLGGYSPVSLVLTGIRFIRLEDPAAISDSIVGAIELEYLPAEGVWPNEIQSLVGRGVEFPELAYVRLDSASEIVVLGATLDILITPHM
jgi:hypothetical protein